MWDLGFRSGVELLQQTRNLLPWVPLQPPQLLRLFRRIKPDEGEPRGGGSMEGAGRGTHGTSS